MTAGEGDAVLLRITTYRGSATPMKMGGRDQAALKPRFSSDGNSCQKPKTQRIWPTIFLKIGRLSPALSKMGGRVPPVPPPPLWRSPWLRMLNIATGYSKNTLSCSELNGEHAGEGFRSIRHILTPLWACKAKKCHFSQKIDLWPDLTRSNIDLGPKNVQSRDLVEAHRLVFSAKLYDHQGPIARGVVPTPPPWPSALWEMPWPGEG